MACKRAVVKAGKPPAFCSRLGRLTHASLPCRLGTSWPPCAPSRLPRTAPRRRTPGGARRAETGAARAGLRSRHACVGCLLCWPALCARSWRALAHLLSRILADLWPAPAHPAGRWRRWWPRCCWTRCSRCWPSSSAPSHQPRPAWPPAPAAARRARKVGDKGGTSGLVASRGGRRLLLSIGLARFGAASPHRPAEESAWQPLFCWLPRKQAVGCIFNQLLAALHAPAKPVLHHSLPAPMQGPACRASSTSPAAARARRAAWHGVQARACSGRACCCAAQRARGSRTSARRCCTRWRACLCTPSACPPCCRMPAPGARGGVAGAAAALSFVSEAFLGRAWPQGSLLCVRGSLRTGLHTAALRNSCGTLLSSAML